MNLKEQGFRFLCNPAGPGCIWMHPAEIATSNKARWVDCTDMSDAEFYAFMGVTLP